MSEPLVLVDGSSYLFRAYHALPPLTNSANEPTGAMYGVINMLRSLMVEYPTKHFIVVFDTKGKTFRHDLYADYKANRPPMPEELAAQIEPLHTIIRAMGLPLVAVPGVEADDVIGTLAAHACAKNINVVISTGDKDMAQLVNEHVTLVNTMSGTLMDIEGVIKKFGVRPEQIIDYLALIGDKVDNVPGVEKVGPKTACKWLAEHQTLENIMENADQVKGKIGQYLRDALAQLPLSKQLVTIDTEVELDQSLDNLCLTEPNNDLLRDLFARYEFKAWLKGLDVPNDTKVTPEKNEKRFETVLTEDDLNRWIDKLKTNKVFAFDTETTSLNIIDAKVVGVSVAISAQEAAYIPFAHDYENAPPQLSEEVVLGALKPILADASYTIIGHNLKYDLNVLLNHQVQLNANLEDTMLASYVFNSTASRHDMDSLAEKYLNTKTISFTDIAGKGAKQLTFNQITLEEAAPYAAEDAAITFALYEYFIPQLKQAEKLHEVYRQIEIPLMPILAKMERTGVLLDSELLHQQSKSLATKIEEYKKIIFKEAGSEFNLDSPKQLQKVLFEDLGLPILSKTPKGQPSTAESVLSELAYEHQFVQQILDYRSLSKLKSTYTDKLPELVNAKSKRVHTSFHQAVTATGRLSSSDPNLQNIPIKSEEGRAIRNAFIVEPGHAMLAADYSQIELRIMAHLSQDPGLLSAFEQQKDIHSQTAAEVFGVNLEDVSSEQRRSAKAINFGLIYGMSSFGLAKQLGVPRDAAQSYIDLYFERYPGVKDYMTRTKQHAFEHGYVATLTGRRLYLPDIKSSNHHRKMAAERIAINAPMQGTAADLIKLAMIHLNHWILENGIEIKMLIQVHDELIFEVPQSLVEAYAVEIDKIMCNVMPLAVPLEVGVGYGKNWQEAH